MSESSGHGPCISPVVKESSARRRQMFGAHRNTTFGGKKCRGIATSVLILFVLALPLVIAARAQVTVDAVVPADQGTKKTSVSTATFSTSSPNELLLAFISADNTSSTNVTVNSVSGAGLTWA